MSVRICDQVFQFHISKLRLPSACEFQQIADDPLYPFGLADDVADCLFNFTLTAFACLFGKHLCG